MVARMILLFLVPLFISNAALAEGERKTSAMTEKPTVLLVDKKLNELKIAHYTDKGYEIFKTFHVTMGQVMGDKQEEGDLKTPEGIYIFTNHLTPPSIKPKFGNRAFYLNYPNPYDKIAGYSGFDIMLHATDAPDRLKKNFDSEGCVVLRNEEIDQVKPYVKLNLTPILIFSEIEDSFLKPTEDKKLTSFFDRWVKAWEGKDINTYINSYHSQFSSGGKSRSEWKTYKAHLNDTYKQIDVKPEKIQFFTHPKYSMVTFIQNYQSTLASGQKGHLSRGTKILYIAEEAGEMKIISEDFTQAVW